MSTVPDGRPPTVLIVDDDRATQTLLAMAMEEEGYATVGAQNGEEALEEFNRLVPNLVLMDAMMPEMDGFTCCERMRSLPGGATVPILTITVLDDQESVDRAFAAGTTDYVTKPIYWPVLCQRVRRLVEAGEVERRLGTVTAELERVTAWEGIMAAALACGESKALANNTLDNLREVLASARELLGGDRGGLWLGSTDRWLEVTGDGIAQISKEIPAAVAEGSLAEGLQQLQGSGMGNAAVWPTLKPVWHCQWGMVVPVGAASYYLWMGRSDDQPWSTADQGRWRQLGQVLGLVLDLK